MASAPSNTPPTGNPPEVTSHPTFNAPVESFFSTLSDAWGIFEQHGFKLLFAAIVLYVLWKNFEPKIKVFKEQQRIKFAPKVNVDEETVRLARQRQQEKYLEQMAEERKFKEAEQRAKVLGTQKPERPAEPLVRRHYPKAEEPYVPQARRFQSMRRNCGPSS